MFSSTNDSFLHQGSSRFALRREEEDENQDDDDGVSDAASFYEEEQEQDQEGEQLSEYERFRQSNILRNDRVLKELGFKTNLPRQVAQCGGKHGTNKVCYVLLPQFYFNPSFYVTFLSCAVTFVHLVHHLFPILCPHNTHTHTPRAHTHTLTHTNTASTDYETSILGKKPNFER